MNFIHINIYLALGIWVTFLCHYNFFFAHWALSQFAEVTFPCSAFATAPWVKSCRHFGGQIPATGASTLGLEPLVVVALE